MWMRPDLQQLSDQLLIASMEPHFLMWMRLNEIEFAIEVGIASMEPHFLMWMRQNMPGSLDYRMCSFNGATFFNVDETSAVGAYVNALQASMDPHFLMWMRLSS